MSRKNNAQTAEAAEAASPETVAVLETADMGNIVLVSPGGHRYEITVSDHGNLKTTWIPPVVEEGSEE